MSTRDTFPMLDGPPISRERAEQVYRIYCCLFGNCQTLQRIAERGGFGHGEIEYMERKHKQDIADGFCTCPKHDPRRTN